MSWGHQEAATSRRSTFSSRVLPLFAYSGDLQLTYLRQPG